MGKKKTTTTTKNTHGYVPYQDTQDTKWARGLVREGADFTSPLAFAYGQAENDIDNQVFEQDLPEPARNKVKAGQLFNIRMQKGAALSDARSREHMAKTSGAMNLANMTQDKFVQTGGTQTTVQPFDWGGMLTQGLMGGAMLASAIPTGGASVGAAGAA